MARRTGSIAGTTGVSHGPTEQCKESHGNRVPLRTGWRLQSSTQVGENGDVLSTGAFIPRGWFPATVPTTVLNALVKDGVYPDPRIGLNNFSIPDASDEFNAEHDLARYSHLPGGENPWQDAYWYRTEFSLPAACGGMHVWLNFSGINYRADVWLNGVKVADREEMVGAFARFRLDVTDVARAGEGNHLAVEIHQVDHVGVPRAQLDVFGEVRPLRSELMKDVTLVAAIGYDCMPTVRDRHMGLWQEVYVDWTGPVDIRDPFVVTDLPLPETNPAYLTISTTLVNATQSRQRGVLKGTIAAARVIVEQQVELAPGEMREVSFSPETCPQLAIDEPQLWWPVNYGEQYLYDLELRFEIDGRVSDREQVAFGIRKIAKELHELDGSYGLRLHVNGQKVFCRGGYIQPEILFDWDAQRMETEIRYLTSANLNLIYFEDIPNPPDEFLDLCDRYGLMFGNCFYGCYWMTPGTDYPLDVNLLSKGTVDILKRYRNHPSLVLYMAMNEGDTREDVYEMWRRHVIGLDGTRLFIPSGSVPDYRVDPAAQRTVAVPEGRRTPIPEWMRKDAPVGMNDHPPKSYGWEEPSTWYRWVREERNWMFMIESGSASLPPIESLRQFIPNLDRAPHGAWYPLDETWAHHGANAYFKLYDSAIRNMFGPPGSVEDYCIKGHLLTADQHRAMFEAANHRMWDITSGFTQWKLNACWPSVQWQIYDWYLRPMVSYYYIKNACEPVHVQLSPLDAMVTVVNNRLEPQENLNLWVRVYDFDMQVMWESRARVDVRANAYRDVFAIPAIPDLTPIYFVRLDLEDVGGNRVSSNFYWLSSQEPVDSGEVYWNSQGNEIKHPIDLSALEELPPVKLSVSHQIERRGEEIRTHVTLENPTDKLAFLIRLAVTRGAGGEEVLPVFWQDNYFSLLPGETRQVSATFAADDLGEATPVLQVGGWNVQNP